MYLSLVACFIQVTATDFVVGGTSSEELYGVCESFYKPDLVPAAHSLPPQLVLLVFLCYCFFLHLFTFLYCAGAGSGGVVRGCVAVSASCC
jgi:hypothetical protein